MGVRQCQTAASLHFKLYRQFMRRITARRLDHTMNHICSMCAYKHCACRMRCALMRDACQLCTFVCITDGYKFSQLVVVYSTRLIFSDGKCPPEAQLYIFAAVAFYFPEKKNNRILVPSSGNRNSHNASSNVPASALGTTIPPELPLENTRI